MILMLRGKDGGPCQPDHSAKKLISKNEEQFDKNFEKLSAIKKPEERIYFTTESRDIKKAMRLFKQRQLDADYFDDDNKQAFYLDIWNRWISCLQNPSCRTETLFLVDIDDDKDDRESINKEIIDNNLEIIYAYPTKNGQHLILKPFNPNLVSFECKKNSLMLLEY